MNKYRVVRKSETIVVAHSEEEAIQIAKKNIFEKDEYNSWITIEDKVSFDIEIEDIPA